MPLKKGERVKQKMPEPIRGEVVDARYDAETGEFHYLVSWTAPDGSMASKWFNESEVEVGQ